MLWFHQEYYGVIKWNDSYCKTEGKIVAIEPDYESYIVHFEDEELKKFERLLKNENNAYKAIAQMVHVAKVDLEHKFINATSIIARFIRMYETKRWF